MSLNLRITRSCRWKIDKMGANDNKMNVRWEDIPPQGKKISLDGLTALLLQGPREGEKGVTLTSTVKGNLFLRRAPKGLETKGRIETSVAIHCARCLKEFVLPIAVTFEEFFLLMKYAPSEDERELLPEEMSIGLLPEGGLELRDIIEEQIWLNIPMKPLCHNQCKGLCSICGADRTITECGCNRDYGDPRFAILEDLRPNLPQRSR